MAWIADGEQVAITMRRKVVARLVPEKPVQRHKVETPDFKSISRRIFGNRILKTDAVQSEREEYRW